jgi:UDP-glucuronate decarboxylase
MNALGATLAGSNVFVTGGTGFVGSHLLDKFAQLNEIEVVCRVTVLSRDPGRFLCRMPKFKTAEWLSFARGSLDELPPPSENYTHVIHAAADTHASSGGARWIDQIVNGTHKVLEFSRQSGAQRFVFTSSGAVYGPQPQAIQCLREDFSGAPPTNSFASVYGQAKRVAEQLCHVYWQEYGLETVVARCFAFSGRYLPLDGPYALGNFVQDALQGGPIRVKGDGTAVRSYLDGRDMADWLCQLLCVGRPGDAYNVGSDSGLCMCELATLIAKCLAPGAEVVVERSASPDLARSIYVPSVEKSRALGLTARYSLEDGISDLAKWALEMA